MALGTTKLRLIYEVIRHGSAAADDTTCRRKIPLRTPPAPGAFYSGLSAKGKRRPWKQIKHGPPEYLPSRAAKLAEQVTTPLILAKTLIQWNKILDNLHLQLTRAASFTSFTCSALENVKLLPKCTFTSVSSKATISLQNYTKISLAALFFAINNLSGNIRPLKYVYGWHQRRCLGYRFKRSLCESGNLFNKPCLVEENNSNF